MKYCSHLIWQLFEIHHQDSDLNFKHAFRKLTNQNWKESQSFFLILEITSSPMCNHKIYNNYGVKVACPCQLNKYISDNSLFSQQNEKRLMHKIVHTNFWTKWYGITKHSSYGLFALARAINRCIWYLN